MTGRPLFPRPGSLPSLSTPSPCLCREPGCRGPRVHAPGTPPPFARLPSLLGPRCLGLYLRCWCLGGSVGARGRGMAGSATCSWPPGRTGARRPPERGCCRTHSRRLGEGVPVRPLARGSGGLNPHPCPPRGALGPGGPVDSGRALTAEVRGPPVHAHALVQAGLGVGGHRVTQALAVPAGVAATCVSHAGLIVGQAVHLWERALSACPAAWAVLEQGRSGPGAGSPGRGRRRTWGR